MIPGKGFTKEVNKVSALVQTKQNNTNSNNKTRLEMDDKTTQNLDTLTVFFRLTSTGAQDSTKEQNNLQHLEEILNEIQNKKHINKEKRLRIC